MPGRAPSSLYYLVGNRLCIDFANSIVAPDPDMPDPIHDWPAFLDFLVAIGALESMAAKALGFLRGRECEDVLRAAEFLRGAIRIALDALAHHRPVQPEQTEYINRILRRNEGYPYLQAARPGRYTLEFAMREEGPMKTLITIARSAAELIVEGPSAPVRKCGNPKCKLYFYDVSRRRDRRWCVMKACGNRAKVTAFIRRERGR
jgi:predicted RNA-binding Zn ribbon-like protein